ncbi:MAG: ABC transporter ATP-binding protein [Acidobacteria bacterium]|nr:ABC transporter ATP-binding protein [Acidobacteriota bacterium]
MSELLRCRGLIKTFDGGARRVEVLRGVDLSVERGEMVAVIGESGVGKSTLLHLLGALDACDSGEYRFDGADVAAMSARERAAFRNRRLGFVFQFHHLLPELSVLENVALPAMIGGRARLSSETLATPLLEALGLGAMLHQRPAELSGGEQQRVAVARALVSAGDLVLADEPTGNLDPRTGDRVFEEFRRVQRERGVAAIVATHSGKLARRCDRVLELKEGVLEPARAPEVTFETAKSPA